ncbi:hypothetical protein FA048_02310 [Pedobacter polaris]|uniref:BACON domain-containing protein n=1 Tax=Pedobacter polaris TaxID=2571273 RepID=A0A4V5P056_9SPHI|nr:MmpS family transport accessory protein [Pedobacter polaris]TKC12472.1 hypothetical protein FA048_02310 [Pedobacter polaris]
MKNLVKVLSLSFAVLSATLLFSCKKDKTSSHVVEYKVSVSSGTLSTVVHTNSQGNSTTITGVGNTTWSSGQITIPSSVQVVNIAADGNSSSAAAAMTVQIIVDGVLKKENTTIGSVMSSQSSYQF